MDLYILHDRDNDSSVEDHETRLYVGPDKEQYLALVAAGNPQEAERLAADCLIPGREPECVKVMALPDDTELQLLWTVQAEE